MAGEAEGVVGGGSPSPEELAAAEAAAAQAQETDDEKVPLKNRFAEFERKNQRYIQDTVAPINQTLAQMMQMLQAQQRPAAAAAGGTKAIGDYTDDELSALASQGYSVAHQELTRREVARQQYAQSQQQAQAMAVREAEQELATLRQQYPAISDQSSPLYQRANAVYGRKSAVMGQNVFTQLDAIKTAILEIRPEAAASERSRAAGADLAASLGGVSHARPAKGDGPRRTTQAEVALAGRMGVKDPAGAMTRLKERMDKGQVSVGPVISSALGDVL